MFERNERKPFSMGTILLMGLMALVILAVVIATRNEQGEKEAKGPGLWPNELFYTLREYPDFKPDIEVYTEAIRETQLQNAAARPRGYTGFSAPWTVQGPGNIGARINTMAIHPDNPNIMYAGYSAGGVWKTSNGGNDWEPVFDDQPFLSIGTIVLDPSNPQTVYVGTGDPNISGYPFIGDGIWKSTDGGTNWEHIGLEETHIVTQIIVDPTNPQTLYAATMGLPFERDNNRGVYKTTDGGASWTQIHFVSEECGAIDLEMSPNDPNVLFVAMWDRIRNNQESLVSGANARIWKTSDAGANWTMLEGGLPIDNNSRIGLAINPQNGNHVLATYAGTNLSYRGLWETLDGGNTWEEKVTQGLNDNFQSSFAWYFGKLYFNPYNPQDIWLLGVRSQRSQDGGITWGNAISNNAGVHVDHHAMGFKPDGTIYIGTDGGMYQTLNNGDTWSKAEQIPATQFYRVAYNPFLPLDYYGGAQDNGTLTGNSDQINDWYRYYGGDGFQPAFHPDNPDVFYAEWQNGNIVGTTNGGDWFEDATSGIDPDDRRHWDAPYIISQHDPNYMFTGTYRVYASYGHLPQWGAVSPDLTDGIVFGSNFHTISTLNESPLDPDILYVGTTDGNVWKGNPLTESWTNITSGLPERYVSSVKGSPSNPDRVFVTHTGYKSNDFQAHVHRSDDQGQTWVPIGGNLPAFAINDIIILPGHQDSILFVATDGGVYGSLTGGDEWERLGVGMPIVPVYDMEYNPISKVLIAGTHARSIQSFPIDSLHLGADVSTYTPDSDKAPELNLYPSIASSEVNVFIENLPVREKAEISICDLSGRVLWKRDFRGGQRSPEQVITADWAPGVYVAFTKTKGKIWANKKFVVAHP
jgi:photosystem II stability/assembly factor-like uncharacterized protein